MWQARERRRNVQEFDGNSRRKETSRKTKRPMGTEWMLGRLAWGRSAFSWLRIEIGGGLL
jgi:hypothetical protein